MKWQFEIWQVSSTGWRWKLRRPNGVMLCMSDEQYASVEKAEDAIVEMQNLPIDVKIVDMDLKAEVKKRSVGTAARNTKKVDKKPAKKKPADS